MLLTPKIEKAIKRASELHDKKNRKVEHNLPYISNLFAVATILSIYAEDEDVLIAGLLHKVMKGSNYTIDELKFEFGSIAAKTVEQLIADSKEEYIEQLKRADARTLMVAAAQNLNELNDLVAQYKKRGAKSENLEEQIKFYEDVLKILEERLESAIVPEYKKVVKEFDKVVNQ